MGDGIVERLTELEGAVKRAAESLARMREENAQLKREVKRLGDERRQVLAQVDMILKDIGKTRPRQAARMSEPRRIELNLLGQTLTIRSEATPEYLRRLAKFLEDRVAQLKRSGVNDPLTALSLAALDIADELFRSREDKTTDEDDVGARLGALVALLDKVAPPDPASDR